MHAHPYVYESIHYNSDNKTKIFTTSMEFSGFHWHHHYELVLILKGQIDATVNAIEYCLCEGDFMLINSRSVHMFRRKQCDNLCLFLQISPQLFSTSKDKFYYFYLNSQDKQKMPENGYSSYRTLLAKTGFENIRPSPNKHRLNSYVYALLADLFDFAVYDIYQKFGFNYVNDMELFSQIVDYIQNNCCNQNVLEDVSKQIGMGEKSLYRFMKKYTGRSPKQFVIEHRLNIAMNLLRNTNYSIPYVASYCGFNAENTFYRSFKKETGLTPGEYQKKAFDTKISTDTTGYLPFLREEAQHLLKKYSSEV